MKVNSAHADEVDLRSAAVSAASALINVSQLSELRCSPCCEAFLHMICSVPVKSTSPARRRASNCPRSETV